MVPAKAAQIAVEAGVWGAQKVSSWYGSRDGTQGLGLVQAASKRKKFVDKEVEWSGQQLVWLSQGTAQIPLASPGRGRGLEPCALTRDNQGMELVGGRREMS